MANQMTQAQFEAFFSKALTDPNFLNDVMADPLGVIAKEGLDAPSKAISGALANLPYAPEVQAPEKLALASKPRCGVCGVCGVCALCAEINAGSASAALWALFHLSSAAAVSVAEAPVA